MMFPELGQNAPLLLQCCLQYANPLSLEAQQLHDRPKDDVFLASAFPAASSHATSHCSALHSSRAAEAHTHARQTNAL